MTWNPTNLHFAAFTLLELNRSKVWGFIRTVFCELTGYSKAITNSNFRLIWTVTVVRTLREEKRSVERKSERKSQRRESKKKEDHPARNGAKVPKRSVFFPCIVAPEGRKVGSLKRWVRSHLFGCDGSKIARGCGAKHIWKLKCD